MSRRIAVRALGIATLVIGAAYVALGVALVAGGIAGAHDPSDWQPLLALLGGMMIVIGLPFAGFGLLVVLAGVGLLFRKPWARWLTFALAIPVACIGYLFAGGPDPGPGATTVGTIQLLYAPIAYVVLIVSGPAFARDTP